MESSTSTQAGITLTSSQTAKCSLIWTLCILYSLQLHHNITMTTLLQNHSLPSQSFSSALHVHLMMSNRCSGAIESWDTTGTGIPSYWSSHIWLCHEIWVGACLVCNVCSIMLFVVGGKDIVFIPFLFLVIDLCFASSFEILI